MTQYAPGSEASSITDNPRFISLGLDGEVRTTDDLRLHDISPALHAGIPLPDGLDSAEPDPDDPAAGRYPAGSSAPPLRVGVDGRRAFPHD
jgi:hypothetical protein